MAKKKEGRVSRREQRRQEVARKNRNRMLMVWLPIGLFIAFFVGLGIYQITRPGIEGALEFGNQERGHDVAATFPDAVELPPVGGVHTPIWQNCGIYVDPVETSLAVHSMEHGAIWITYQPDLSSEEVLTLQEHVRENSSLRLISPYPNLKSKVVLTGWGVQLELDSVEDERITQFIDRYEGGGPEPGAGCTNGQGVPVQ